MTGKISRRAFLTLPEKPEADSSSPATSETEQFSLSAYYARRTPVVGPLPRFAVTLPTEKIETTAIGITRSAIPPWKLKRAARGGDPPKLGGPVGVVRSACLAWQGSACWTCSERCPVEGAVSLDRGRPIIDAARCDGCGECVAACPAPHNALKLAAHGGTT